MKNRYNKQLLKALLGLMEHLQSNTTISKSDICWKKAVKAVMDVTVADAKQIEKQS